MATQPVHRGETSGFAIGVTAFAAVLLIIVGFFHIITGIAAIGADDYFVVSSNYVFEFDTTSWGWIHLISGIVVALAGFALFTGATWARVIAVILAMVSVFANFLWLPYYPFWSLLIIAVDIVVIWALTVHGRDIAEA